jgi:large subunit ribosomal protein L21
VKIQAIVTGHERGKKIHGLKFKPKRGYKRRFGARSHLTRLEISSINAGARKASSKAAAKQEASDGS